MDSDSTQEIIEHFHLNASFLTDDADFIWIIDVEQSHSIFENAH